MINNINFLQEKHQMYLTVMLGLNNAVYSRLIMILVLFFDVQATEQYKIPLRKKFKIGHM